MTNLKRVISLIFLFAISISSCSPNSVRQTATPQPTIIEPRPDFVLETAPSETQVLPISLFEAKASEPGGLSADEWENIDGYNSDVCLKTDTILLAQKGDNFRNDSMVPRITMIVDGVEAKAISVNGILLQSIHALDTDGNIIKWGVEPRLICGSFVLEPGVHEVLFQFRQTSGDILEYRWQFGLTED